MKRSNSYRSVRLSFLPMVWSSLPIPESKLSLSGLEKAKVGFEPAGMPPDKLNFADEPRYAPVVGSIPNMVAMAGSITPAGPVPPIVGVHPVDQTPPSSDNNPLY